MGLLATLASLLGIEVGGVVSRLKENAVAVAAISLFALIGIAFLLVAAYTALTAWVGPIWSPLIIAAAALVIALILYIALRIQNRAVARREAQRRRERETTALVASAALAALPELLKTPILRNVGIPLALYAAFLLFSGRHSSAEGASSEKQK
jgi:chromate transport protein ChrA